MTEHEAQEGLNQGLNQGLNRRHLFQTLAAGAAVSGVIGAPALAQQPPAERPVPTSRTGSSRRSCSLP